MLVLVDIEVTGQLQSYYNHVMSLSVFSGRLEVFNPPSQHVRRNCDDTGGESERSLIWAVENVPVGIDSW